MVCEGASEKVLLNHLIGEEESWHKFLGEHIYILDSGGKFNMHRYMNLFGLLGISHSVLIDKDKNSTVQTIVNDFLDKQKNEFTVALDCLDDDIESFLGVPKTKDRWLKPLNLIRCYRGGRISQEKIISLRQKLEHLVGLDGPSCSQ